MYENLSKSLWLTNHYTKHTMYTVEIDTMLNADYLKIVLNSSAGTDILYYVAFICLLEIVIVC